MGRRKRIYGKRRKRPSPLQMEPKVGYFKQFPSEKSKLTTSLIGELSAKKDILSGFGAIDLSRPLGSGTISTTASGVLEGSKKRQDIIGSLGAGYKTKKGLYLGGSLEKGLHYEHDPYAGRITTKGEFKPKLNIKKTTQAGNIYSLKVGKDSAMFGLNIKF